MTVPNISKLSFYVLLLSVAFAQILAVSAAENNLESDNMDGIVNGTSRKSLQSSEKYLEATVEDISDSEDADYTPPNLDDHDDMESEGSEVSEDEEADIKDDAVLLTFINVLSMAQEAATEAERAKAKASKQPKTYTGNSARSHRRFSAKRKKIASEGHQSFISSWLQVVAQKTNLQVSQTVSESESVGATASVESVSVMDSMNGAINLREEEEESDLSEPSKSEGEFLPKAVTVKQPKQIEEMLQDLRNGQCPHDNDQETLTDITLNALSYQDFPALRHVRAKLIVQAKNKQLDVIFWACISAMTGALNLYLDPELSYSWCEASLLVTKSHGKGSSHARNIRTWIHHFLHHKKLPLHHYGRYSNSILEDEDFAQDIQLHLMEVAKHGYICAQDIVDYITRPEVQGRLGSKKTGISLATAQRWMHKLDWRYGKKQNGMYIDGHEQEDVVKYRKEFLQRWKEYEKRMVMYDNDGNVLTSPSGFPVAQGSCFRLILVTHNESTFYANDQWKNRWNHSSDKATPEQKGEGPSLMISDMVTLDLGRLKDDEEEARTIFKAGKN
ncbi:uncharacterized protein F5147DRAFT_772825 [Suillus discolor]|uniref:Uncharacterized protein n=1 Tax=Suillus discolor TaxID=1912936 RepID=A0A9P7F9B1_9AGAM|nr:uncharacterized protein F5147DRAFT_772825 [Suillus discolor]KAG2109983.1 hypothetical protein F5147DRAFT_772825 [Suillus discolor]